LHHKANPKMTMLPHKANPKMTMLPHKANPKMTMLPHKANLKMLILPQRLIMGSTLSTGENTLAVGLNALARLDWRSRKMRLYAEQAVAARLQRALQLDNALDRTKGRDNDTFDMQSLSLLAQSLVSLADELPSTSVLRDLFSLASTSPMGVMARRLHTKEVGSNQVPAGQLAQLRVFKNACQILKYCRPNAVEEMFQDSEFGEDIRQFF
ncbi:hypothetical protein FOZ62_007876, partial [Perkinsus olseni]